METTRDINVSVAGNDSNRLANGKEYMEKENRIIMLGTGSATVTRCYNTCFVVESGSDRLMVDAGGGNGGDLLREGGDIPQVLRQAADGGSFDVFVAHILSFSAPAGDKGSGSFSVLPSL